MSFFNEILQFEKQSISTIAANMVHWFNVDEVNIRYESRPEVASRVWIVIEIKINADKYHIDGQRNDIVHRRLIEWLKKYLESSN